MTNSTNRQTTSRAFRNASPFSNPATLAATRTINARNQQNRVRGGVVTPPHPNDPVTSLSIQEDIRLMDSVQRSIQQQEDESFLQSIMSTAVQHGRQTGRSSLFENSPYNFFRDPQVNVRTRDFIESNTNQTRRTVVLPRPEDTGGWLNIPADNTAQAVMEQRNDRDANTLERTPVRVGGLGIGGMPMTTAFTGPLGFNNRGQVVGGNDLIRTEEPRINQPIMNWGETTNPFNNLNGNFFEVETTRHVREPLTGGTVQRGTLGQNSGSTFSDPPVAPITKKTLVEILRNEYELKIDARKYGDRMEFKISLFNNTTKEEVLSAEDYVEMDN